ncbi:PKD1L2 [Blepharisma stoltei]|uniref:Polycystin domain-containing protein n=1 Tax=Blepharisma stoltei TaxID=1481888 RepID=A0AAU9II27_9CILI|nr:unnamed protein product [Blepharisma stoltei]
MDIEPEIDETQAKNVAVQLGDQIEQAKEEIEQIIDKGKELRDNIRRKKRELEKIKDQIHQAASKLNAQKAEENKKAGPSLLNDTEQEAYNMKFNEVITEMFNYYSSKYEIENGYAKFKENLASVDVEFEGQRVSFFVNYTTTFNLLRERVSSYWSVPIDDIFFTDIKPDDINFPNPPIFLGEQFVMDEIYPWNHMKCKNNLVLYLILRKYQSLEDKVEELLPKTHMRTDRNSADELKVSDDEQTINDKKRKKGQEPIDHGKEIKKKQRTYTIISILQSIFSLTLFLLWSFMMPAETLAKKAVWMNHLIEQKFLWDFDFRYDVYSMHMETSSSTDPYVMILDEVTFWDYVYWIEQIVFANNIAEERDYGTVSDNIKMIGYVEFRQVRSKVHQCEEDLIKNYTCADSFSLDDADKTDYGTYDGFKYKTSNNDFIIYGSISSYNLDGFSAYLDPTNFTDWSLKKQRLIANKWIDPGTRAVFLTFNLANVDLGLLTTVMPFVEIDRVGNYFTNFQIYTINYELYKDDLIYYHVFIFILLFFATIFEIRRLFLPRIFYKYMAKKFLTNEESDVNFKELNELLIENNKKPFYKRLRKPNGTEIFVFVVLVCAWIMEITKLIWYSSAYKPGIDIDTSTYTNLIKIGYEFQAIENATSIIIVTLALTLLRYGVFYSRRLTLMYNMVKRAMIEICVFLFFCVCTPIIGFTVLYFYMLGPWDMTFSRVDYAFLGIIRLVLGDWPTKYDAFYIVPIGYIIIYQLVFAVWRIIIINCQIINLKEVLSLSRTKALSTGVKSRRKQKEEENQK